jgi:hypothetical protein
MMTGRKKSSWPDALGAVGTVFLALGIVDSLNDGANALTIGGMVLGAIILAGARIWRSRLQKPPTLLDGK